MTDPAEATTWNNPHLERLLLRYGSGPARGEYDDLLKERDRLRALADPAPSDEVAYLRDLNRQMGAKLDRLSAAPRAEPCSGDYGCFVVEHIEGCYAIDESPFGRACRIAALTAKLRRLSGSEEQP